MDSGVIRDLAGRMDRLASQLDQLIGTVDSTVGRASAAWFGSDQEAFHQAWNGTHRPVLLSLREDIQSLATTARTNANQQDTTSAVTTTRTVGRGGVAGFSLMQAAEDFSHNLDAVNHVLGVPDDLKRLDEMGHLLHVDSVTAPLEHTLLRVTTGLEHHLGAPLMKGTGEVFAGAAATLGAIGLATSVGSDSAHMINDLRSGNVDGAAHDVADAASSALKSSKDPVTYLAGVIVAEGTDVIDLGRNIDWSQPIPTPTPSNLLHDYVPAVGEALKESVPYIMKDWL